MAAAGARNVAGELTAGADSHSLFAALLLDLKSPGLAVVEDAHWADEATLDMLRFVARRIEQTRSLLLVTLRDDEVGPDHPLRSVLGDLATTSAGRLRVSPLSLDGVRRLASEHPMDPDRLYAATAGNPFYVTEVLAAPGWTVPPSVRDAVHARIARLPGEVRAPLEAVSIDPGPVERAVLHALGVGDAAISHATQAAVLLDDGDRLRFRHELARLAVADGIDSGRRADLHRRMLDALVSAEVADAARLAHHASGSGDPEAELRWTMAAAAEAASAGAHREAAAHYSRAAQHAGLLEPAEAIGLFERQAEMMMVIDQPARAVEAWERALELRRRTDDPVGIAATEAQLARSLWNSGRGDEAYALIARVTEALEGKDEARVSMAFATRAYLAMLARRSDEAVTWARRALELRPGAGDLSAQALALNALGAARICGYADVGGVDDLLRSRDIGAEMGSRRYVAGAYTNLGSGLGEIRRYPEAERYLVAGIEYGTAHDLDSTRNYNLAWLSRVRFEQGRWTEALNHAEQALAAEGISPISPIVALTVQARVRARRGEPDGDPPLMEAWRLARQTGDLQRLWPAAAARAELAWLTAPPGDPPASELRADLEATLELAREKGLAWAIGELAFWHWKLGLGDPRPEGAAPAYALMLRGDAAAAAAAWKELGCRYEEAWALADTGQEAAMREGLATLIELGAAPLAERVRHALRAMGATRVPMARRRASATPSGLTRREHDVLMLLTEGLTDRQIAERLFLSPKTAGHHVSSILAKLGVRTRTEAATTAISMGLLDGEIGEPSR
jgi:DNA-binding CsgD family transcriptional regulator/tetratricopeptide (TPR) repeat protein